MKPKTVAKGPYVGSSAHVSGDAFELALIRRRVPANKGKWYHTYRDPELAGIRLVGGADKADVVQQGDNYTIAWWLGDQGSFARVDNVC